MALRLRRGTNAERLAITPAEGELIYTTDTKKIFTGDGSTVGGNIVSGINNLVEDGTPQLGGTLDMNSQQISGTGTIDITGSITSSGTITASQFVGDYKGSIVGDDSTILVDAVNNKIPASALFGTASINVTGNVVGNLTGNATGQHLGTLDGDVTGSVFADDSSVLVDGVGKAINNISTGSIATLNSTTINTTTINATTVNANLVGNTTGNHTGNISGSVFGDDSSIIVDGINNTIAGQVNNNLVTTKRIDITTTDGTDAELKLNYGASGAGPLTVLGAIKWNEGATTYGYMSANRQAVYINSNGGGKGLSLYNAHLVTGGVKVKIEPANTDFSAPTEALEVLGNVKATGAFMLPVYADATARDTALSSPAAGMVVFNSTGFKFQGYTGATWVDLN